MTQSALILRHHVKNSASVIGTNNPSAREAEVGRALEFAGQPV